MALPPFQEFLASLDKETLAGIMRDAGEAAKLVLDDPKNDPRDIPDLQVRSMALQTSLEVLAVYHKWLEQHD